MTDHSVHTPLTFRQLGKAAKLFVDSQTVTRNAISDGVRALCRP